MEEICSTVKVYRVTKQVSLRQDGNGDWVYDDLYFSSKESAEKYIEEHENGWVHFSDITECALFD